MVELERGIPLDKMSLPHSFQDVDDFRMEPIDSTRLLEFYRNMGFKDLERRITERLRFSDKNASVTTNTGIESTSAVTKNSKIDTRRDAWPGNSFTAPRQFRTPPNESFDDVPF